MQLDLTANVQPVKLWRSHVGSAGRIRGAPGG
jgi:hypothetical protein